MNKHEITSSKSEILNTKPIYNLEAERVRLTKGSVELMKILSAKLRSTES